MQKYQTPILQAKDNAEGSNQGEAEERPDRHKPAAKTALQRVVASVTFDTLKNLQWAGFI